MGPGLVSLGPLEEKKLDIVTPLCKCGKPAIIRRYKNGRKPSSMGTCHECLSLRMKGISKNPKNQIKRAKRSFLKKHKLSGSISHPMIITLDFSRYQDIYLKLKEKANVEMRTVESQIIYHLRTI
jgi:hypothetical protein